MSLRSPGRFHSSLLLAAVVILAVIGTIAGCKTVSYKFNDTSIPPEIKIIKINYIENRAPYVNPQLSPQLTDRLRQKITSQTRLTQTNGDGADWEVSAEVRDYSFTTSAISNQQTTGSRITVSISMKVFEKAKGTTKDYSVSRNFDFSSSESIQQAEARLSKQMITDLTDDMFNRLFSNW